MKLFSRASDDVKLSLLLDSLPKLNVKKILADMSESEKEVKQTQTTFLELSWNNLFMWRLFNTELIYFIIFRLLKEDSER